MAKIACPACKSEVSADGSTLHVRSKYLEDLIETDADVGKLEEVVKSLEGRLQSAKQELEQAKAELQEKSKPEARTNEVLGAGQRNRSGDDWW